MSEPKAERKSPAGSDAREDEQRVKDLLRAEAARAPDPAPDEEALRASVQRVQGRAEKLESEGPFAGSELLGVPLRRGAQRSWTRTLFLMSPIAAMTLFAFGACLFWSRWTAPERGESVPITVEPNYAATRTGGAAAPVTRNGAGDYLLEPGRDLELRVRGERDGLATIVLMSSSGLRDWPRSGEAPIKIKASEPTLYGPLMVPPEPTRAIVVVGESAIAAAKLESLATAEASLSAAELKQRIEGELWAAGERWVSVAVLQIRPVQAAPATPDLGAEDHRPGGRGRPVSGDDARQPVRDDGAGSP